MSKEILDPRFSLFNSHINKAADRAKTKFIMKFGQSCWNKEIQPFLDKGVMSIFHVKPNKFTKQYVGDITFFVNELPENQDGRRSQRLNAEQKKRNQQIQKYIDQIKV